MDYGVSVTQGVERALKRTKEDERGINYHLGSFMLSLLRSMFLGAQTLRQEYPC